MSKFLENRQAQDRYSFEDPGQARLFNEVIHKLRCSVCQNQTLSDSRAPLALDLRQEIYQKIKLGSSKEEVIEFVTARYGNFVLYQPPLQFNTLLLWGGPLIILLLALKAFSNYFK